MASCVLVGPVPPPFGGMAVYLAHLRRELEQAGIACEVIGLSHRAHTSPLARYGNRCLSFLSAILRLPRTRGRVVICFSGSELNLVVNGFVVCWAKTLGKKVVLRLSGGRFKDSLSTTTGLSKWWLRMVFRHTDRIMAVNQEIGESLTHHIPPDKIIVLSNALPFSARDLQCITEAMDDDQNLAEFLDDRFPIVTCVGGGDPMYGCELLIRAVAQLRSELQEIRLVLILKAGALKGSIDEVLALVRTLDLQSFARVLTDLPREQVLALLRRSHLFVRPSFYDGDSNAVREALALGLPVLASDAAPRPRGVSLFQSGDLDSLVAAMRNLVTGLRQEDGAGGADLLAAYQAEGRSNLQQIVRLYEQLAIG